MHNLLMGDYSAICGRCLLNWPLCRACMFISTAGAFDARTMDITQRVFVSFGMPASAAGFYDSDNPEGRNTQCLLQHK